MNYELGLQLYSQKQRNISSIKNTNKKQQQYQMNKQNYNTNIYSIHHHHNHPTNTSLPNTNHPNEQNSPTKSSQPSMTSYSQLLTLCQDYRKRIQYLEQQVSVLKLHMQHPINVGIDRAKQLQQQYMEHKRYMYQDYKRQKMEMKKIVEYLVGCYEEFVGGEDVGFEGFVREVKENGPYKTIQRLLAPNQGLNLTIQNKKQTLKQSQSFPHITPSSLLSPYQILDQTQSTILRRKIQTLTNILHTLTTSYKKQLKQLKEQITGKSKHMIEEIKQCIYRNFNHIKPFNSGAGGAAGGRSKSGSRQDIVDEDKLSGSREKKMGKGEKQGRSSGVLEKSKVENKRLSLQHTIQIVNPRKPPLPPNPNPSKTPKTTPLSQSFNLHNTHNIFPSSSKNQQNWSTNRNNMYTSTPKNSTHGSRTQHQNQKIKLKEKNENRRKNTEERGKDEEKGINNGRGSWGYGDKGIRL